MRREKRERERNRKTKRGQRRVYDVTQVTYEIIIGLETFVRAALHSRDTG